MNYYEEITKKGYDVDYRRGEGGLDRLYLVKDDKRTGEFITFWGNNLGKKNIDKILNNDYKKDSHLYFALKQINELVDIRINATKELSSEEVMKLKTKYKPSPSN